MDSSAELNTLREDWVRCTRCDLQQIRGQHCVVFGSGPSSADYLVIYTAASKGDTLDGTPFDDEAGTLFISLLHKAGIHIQNVYRTPLVACRPYAIVPATAKEKAHDKDRPPSREEIQACLPRVMATIYIVDPRIIFAVGNEAMKALVPAKDRGRAYNTLARATGNLFVAKVPGRIRTLKYTVMPLLHPLQLIGNPSDAKHGPIVSTLEAMMRAKAYVDYTRSKEGA